ncbi:MAG TPA: hypothetical protein VMP01_23330 [Pirellulaceae bacterium]|nr:hypothetical protein [Pirellulaceae bacterium]
MTANSRCLAFAAVTSIAVLLSAAEPCQAQGGRYRAVTSYSFPSTPVYTPGVPLQSVYRPAFVAPAAAMPVASGPIAVTPPIVYSPQAAYYAPAPVTGYYAPAPVTSYYGAPVAVQPTVVARPAFFPRARNVYSFTPARGAAIPVVVP